jgi:hypothetical protein
MEDHTLSLCPTADCQSKRQSERHLSQKGEMIPIDELRKAATRKEAREDEHICPVLERLPCQPENCAREPDADDYIHKRAQPFLAGQMV